MNREQHLAALREGTFDILIVGGGATGAGTALDAASRGLRVGLIERDDFAAGTSSRSTKLIHGGVRYLEQAVKGFDAGQLHLVREALREREVLLRIAPHLSRPLPLMTPLYNWLEVPYFTIGLKLYDLLAGKANLHGSRFVSARKALEQFPMLRGKGLRGGVVYYDGQFDDARMNLAIALTAAEKGAVVANHVEVTALVKTSGRVSGAAVIDRVSGESWEISARVVVNATGPAVDAVRRLDDADAPAMVSASSGVHLVLHPRFSPPETGLLIPRTEDGRVLFLLPWQGHTVVGTTDNPAPVEAHPKAGSEEIDYLLRHVRKYFSLPVEEEDILATWSGLRPLVSNPNAGDTARLSRDHVISISDSGLVTIAGGKWTTYRKMALDTVDEAVRTGGLSPHGPSRTEQLELVGAAEYDPAGSGRLEESYGLEPEVSAHLNESYGDRAGLVGQLAADGFGKRLSPAHPYLEAEVIYAARHEAARSAADVLARRTRLGFLDQSATKAAIPRVVELLAAEFDRDEEWRRAEEEAALGYFS